jgi:DNA-directed RNA polymerase subunit M/transcription elongation factor TFIIS
VPYDREMARELDRKMTCRKCGVETIHRVFNTRTGNGKVTRFCKCEQCETLNQPCGAR